MFLLKENKHYMKNVATQQEENERNFTGTSTEMNFKKKESQRKKK
jgi:hypothetical protein